MSSICFISRNLCPKHRTVERKDNELLKAKFGDDIPDVRDLAKDIQLLLVNQHFSMSGSRPLSPQVIEIGGVHILPTKEIPLVGTNRSSFIKC